MSTTPAPGDGHGWRLPAALLAVYVVWGSTYLAMKIALGGFPPMLMAGVRFLIAGALLFGFLALRGHALPSRGEWLRSIPVGGLLFVCGNGFVAIGEQEVGSGLAAVIVATMPLWMAVLSAMSGERPRAREWLGLAIGVLGVVVLSLEGELRGAPLATFFLFLAPVCWALGSVLSRRLALPRGPMAPAAQMLVGGLGSTLVSVAIGEPVNPAPPTAALLAIAYLVVFGSLVAFMAYAWLLAHTRPTVATSYAFVNPIIAVVLGAALGAERFGWQTAAAAPLIVAAVALVVTAKAGARPGSTATAAMAHSTTTPPQGHSPDSVASSASK